MGRRRLALLVLAGLAAAGVPGTAGADDGDDTLRLYLSKADVVVLGEFTSELEGFTREAGVVTYGAEFAIARLIKGAAGTEPRAGSTIRVNVIRFESDAADRRPELKKGGRCILFLTRNGRQQPPTYRTADVWFGVQPPSPWMARSLARLAAEKAPPEGAPGDGGKETAPSDDDRLARLRAEMTYEEISRLWRGKQRLGQSCGEGVNKLTGESGGAYADVYEWKPSHAPGPQSLKVWYFQGKDGPYEVRGPGFHYCRKGGKYVAVEGPPKRKPAEGDPPGRPGAAAVPAKKGWDPALAEGGFPFKDAAAFRQYLLSADTVAAGRLAAWDGTEGKVQVEKVYRGTRGKVVSFAYSGGLVRAAPGDKVLVVLVQKEDRTVLHSVCAASGLFALTDDLEKAVKEQWAAAEKPAGLWAGVSVSRPLLVQGGKTADGPMQLRFTLVNDGNVAVNPDIGSSRLLVNGKEMKDWAFIAGQGPRDERWRALPPGGHIRFGYAMGEYFDEPGVYRVSWRGKGFESPEVVFRVVPKAGK